MVDSKGAKMPPYYPRSENSSGYGRAISSQITQTVTKRARLPRHAESTRPPNAVRAPRTGT
jgi:hypothetical protein